MRTQPTITRAYSRYYSDNKQTTFYVEWSDGSRTEGRVCCPMCGRKGLGLHMTALIDAATRRGINVTHEVW